MKRRGLTLWILVALLIGIGIYGLMVEPMQLEVKELWIKDSNLTESLGGLTVVQISDLHISMIGPMEKKVLEIVEEVNPHLLFLTGDYVTWKGDYEPALQFLSRLEAKFGVWAVMGDYDYSNSRKSCLFCHEQGTGKPTNRHPVKFLRDQMIRVNVNGKAVWIGGVRSEEEHTMAAFETRDESNSREPAIILSHSPLRFDLVDKSRDVLVLGGDTHGGQVPLPSWVWKILGYEKNEKYPHGLYEEGKAKLYVSKGVGTSHVAFRFLRRPEIVVIHFTTEDSKEPGA